MSTVCELRFQVGSRDVDLTGCARPSAVLGYLQEAATVAAGQLGCSRPETVAKYNCVWMIVRTWVRLDRPLRWDETLTVQTWHRGARGASSFRDFDLLVNGQSVGEAVTSWVLVDKDTLRIFRMDGLAEFQGTDGGERCKTVKLHRVRLPQRLPAEETRVMRYSDTDINGHVNNARYADFACDALHLEEKLKGRFVHEFSLNYSAQCMAGETLRLCSAQEEDCCWVRAVGPEGDTRFECVLRTKEL